MQNEEDCSLRLNDLTTRQIEQLPAGPYIDALVAEALFELQVKWGQRTFYPMWQSFQFNHPLGWIEDIPRYSTDPDDNGFVQRLFKKNYGLMIDLVRDGQQQAWIAQLPGKDDIMALARTKELAVCRCVLLYIKSQLSRTRNKELERQTVRQFRWRFLDRTQDRV